MEMQPVGGKKLLVWQPGTGVLIGRDCFDLVESLCSLEWSKRSVKLSGAKGMGIGSECFGVTARGDWIWKMKMTGRDGGEERSWVAGAAVVPHRDNENFPVMRMTMGLLKELLSILSFKLFSQLSLWSFFHISYPLLSQIFPKSLLTDHLI